MGASGSGAPGRGGSRRSGSAPRTDGGSTGGLLGGLETWQVVAVAGVAGLVLVAALGAAAGAVFLLSGTGSAADLQLVPDGVDAVTYVDVDQVTSDEGIREVVDAYLERRAESPFYRGPTSTAEALDRFENETGLDPERAHRVTTFSKYDEETGRGAAEYSATIVRSDWTEEEVVSAIERRRDVSLQATDYKGATLYEPVRRATLPAWVAVLGDGTYVIGTERAVKDVVDVDRGEAEPLSGELKGAFQGTRSGYVRFAARVPEERVPDRGLGAASGVNTSRVRAVEIVSGAYFSGGNTLGTETTFHATDEDTARDVEDVTRGSLSLARGLTKEADVKAALRDVEVTRDGRRVTITYENTVDDITAALEAAREDDGADGPSTETAGVEPVVASVAADRPIDAGAQHTAAAPRRAER